MARADNKVMHLRDTHFNFGERSECNRLQASINKQGVMHNGNFNKTKYVFPNWRSVNKSKWVVPNMPFVTTTTSQYKRQEKPVSHDPYIEKVAV